MYLESQNSSFEVVRCRIFAIVVDESGFVTMYVRQTPIWESL